MSDPAVDRRALLAGAALAVAATGLSAAAPAQAATAGFAPQPQALPFDPKAVG